MIANWISNLLLPVPQFFKFWISFDIIFLRHKGRAVYLGLGTKLQTHSLWCQKKLRISCNNLKVQSVWQDCFLRIHWFKFLKTELHVYHYAFVIFCPEPINFYCWYQMMAETIEANLLVYKVYWRLVYMTFSSRFPKLCLLWRFIKCSFSHLVLLLMSA